MLTSLNFFTFSFEILPFLVLFLAISLGFSLFLSKKYEISLILFSLIIFLGVIVLTIDCLNVLWLTDLPYLHIKLGVSWFHVLDFQVEWGFLYDYLTFVMLFVVLIISFCVQVYSLGYMEHDPSKLRFFSYLNLFTFFMLFLVSADNFIQMFIGWEGVGLCSYLLINFWYTRLQANKAAIKALLVNKIGDCAMLFAFALLLFNFETVNYLELFFLIQLKPIIFLNFCYFNISIISVICFFFLIGAMAKSAQIGLHTWLPDAMEGPTPVSALIHAATMVTAGIFLIIRCAPLFDLTPTIKILVTIIGASTAFFAATVAFVQFDMKKVIAYSTCSQLGYMMFACGLSQYSTGLYHLTTHAFFKALLFLSAGSVIHALQDEQDFRKMGGLAKLLPFTYSVMLIGSLSLAGFPFLSGFYSKDLILEQAFGSLTFEGRFAFWLGSITAFLTAFYSIRLLYFVFFDVVKIKARNYKTIHEPNLFIIIPLFILLVFSVCVGYFLQDFFTLLGVNYMVGLVDYEFIPLYIKLLPTIFSLFGMIFCIFYYKKMKYGVLVVWQLPIFSYIYHFFGKKWYFDSIYNNYIVLPIWHLGDCLVTRYVDKGWLETFGPTGVSRAILFCSRSFSQIQSGFVSDYLYNILLGILFVFWLMFKIYSEFGF